MFRTRTLTALAALVAAGCAAPAALDQLQGTQAPIRTRVAQVASGPDLVVYGTGQALNDNRRDTDRWAFSLRAVKVGDHIEHGQVLICSSINGRNRTMFGTIDSGTITQRSTGGGTASFSCTLTTGQKMNLRVVDVNSDRAWDRLEFDVPGTTINWRGTTYCGGIRLLRSRPLAQGTLNQTGYKFDPRIGLFIVAGDLAGEKKRAEQPQDRRVVEVTRPDPLIDFRKDDPGGIVNAAGSDDNQPSQ